MAKPKESFTELTEKLNQHFLTCRDNILSAIPLTSPKYAICDNLSLTTLLDEKKKFPRSLTRNPSDQNVKEFLTAKLTEYMESVQLQNPENESIFSELEETRLDKIQPSRRDQTPSPSKTKDEPSHKKTYVVSPLSEETTRPCCTGGTPGTGQIQGRDEYESPNSEDSDEENQEKDNEEDIGSFSSKFPHLPGGYCPRNLFIYTMRPLFLNSLYETTPNAFPKKWNIIKKKDPIAAWNSLNQTVIRYLNSAYSDQGFKVDPAETAVDFYNILELKREINDTIRKSIRETLDKTDTPEEATRGPMMSNDTSLLMARLNEALRFFTSESVKRSGKELNIPPRVYQGGPGLGVAKATETLESKVVPSQTTSTYNDLESDESGDWV